MKLSPHDLGFEQPAKPGRSTASHGVIGGRLWAFVMAAWTGGCARTPAICAHPMTSRTALLWMASHSATTGQVHP